MPVGVTCRSLGQRKGWADVAASTQPYDHPPPAKREDDLSWMLAR